MKMLGKTILSILALAVFASAATNYTVKSGGGGNYATIQSCANAMAAGDTCTVYAGTYNESVTVPAGTAGNYKTITVNGSDAVMVTGNITMGSHTKLIGNCAAQGQQAQAGVWGTCGFSYGGGPSSASGGLSPASNASDIYIIGNACESTSGACWSEGSGNTTDSIYIGSNTFSYPCGTPSSPNVCTVMKTNGNHHLIELNDFSHMSDGPYLNGKWLVMRNNVMHDVQTSDCGSNSSNCHIDFQQSDTSGGPSGGPIQFELFEGNTVTNWLANGGSVGGSGVHAVGLFQEDACSGNCHNGIVRFHKVSHFDGGGDYCDTNDWSYLKVYNISAIDINRKQNSNGQLFDTSAKSCTHSAELNNIYYFTVTLSGFNAYECEGSSCNTFTYGHSLAFCTQGSSSCNAINGHVYGQGSFGSDIGNIINQDPLFVSYSGNNFNLQAGSPARNAGANLATVNGTVTNSTSLVVDDAAYFFDGWGIANAGSIPLQADCIAVTTIANHVCISSINYATNTLTLTSPISAVSGDPVWLYSISDGTQVLTDSTGPDMGAFPYGSSITQVAPPTGLAAVVN